LLIPVTGLVVIWGFTATLTIERGHELLRIQTVYDNVVTPVRGVISALQQERFLIGFQAYDRLMISPGLDLVEQTKAIILVSRSREIVSQESAVVTGALAAGRMTVDERDAVAGPVGKRRLLYQLGAGQLDAELSMPSPVRVMIRARVGRDRADAHSMWSRRTSATAHRLRCASARRAAASG
jgi:hypothetical protein